MFTATLFFNFDMTMICPHCQADIDLENGDEGYWIGKFKNWINNVPGADKINEEFECPDCEKTFTIDEIER